MKHKLFNILAIVLMSTLIFNGCDSSARKDSESCCKLSDKEIYEWRIYTLTGDGAGLDAYFKDALIPAYNRCGVSVGAFSLFKEEENEQRYLLFVYPDLMIYNKVRQTVWSDADYQNAARSFFETSASDHAYTEYETYICEAFDKIPKMRMPDKNRTLFEYRCYHSPNEDANQRKIKMFNAEEIDLFDKVGINSVCYGEVLSGTHMPALIYLTWSIDEPTRNEAWATFSAHPEWKEMKGKQEYKNTATRNQVKLLSPLPYSQF